MAWMVCIQFQYENDLHKCLIDDGHADYGQSIADIVLTVNRMHSQSHLSNGHRSDAKLKVSQYKRID